MPVAISQQPLALLVLVLGSLLPLTANAAEPAPAGITECDRLAAHPSDPDKVVDGVSSSAVRGWNEAAIGACRQALAAAPDEARLRYQLGRALFYSGRHAEGLEHLAIAALATHRQAQFVLGLMYTDGVPEVLAADTCQAMALWQDAASRGHFAARVALGRDWARGSYRACPEAPTAEQVGEWLEQAREATGDYYQRLLIDWAREVIAAGR